MVIPRTFVKPKKRRNLGMSQIVTYENTVFVCTLD